LSNPHFLNAAAGRVDDARSLSIVETHEVSNHHGFAIVARVKTHRWRRQ
jgi:hypothetical protein